MISCFFATGTGRCGTTIFSKILNCSTHAHCNHEYSINAKELKKAFFKKKPKLLNSDIKKVLQPEIKHQNKLGKIYGECSGHLYMAYPQLFKKFKNNVRFMLLVRNPADFIRSALARGFFDPGHPHGLEHVIPPPDSKIAADWNQITPFEKCAWYWAKVNGMVYRFFLSLPKSAYRIIQIEQINIDILYDLYQFLGLRDFNDVRSDIQKLLGERHNASPGSENIKSLNPYSETISLGPKKTWSKRKIQIFEKHVNPLEGILYGSEEPTLFFHDMSKLD